MKAIYKYPVSIDERQVIEMPLDAQILDIRENEDGAGAYLWAIVDLENSVGQRLINGYLTGRISGSMPIPSLTQPNNKYIKTLHFNGGAFVFHFFDGGYFSTEGKNHD